MDEFAMGSSNETSFFGPVKNPWDTTRSRRLLRRLGRRGRRALAPAATGTDTGGSIRQPAALCNLTGMKPTYGVVSRYGMIAFASSLDQAGPMAARPKTARCCSMPWPASTNAIRPASTGRRRLRPLDLAKAADRPEDRPAQPSSFGEAACPEVMTPPSRRPSPNTAGWAPTTVEVSLPNMELSVPAYYVIAPAEASSNLSRFDGVRYGYRAPEYSDLNDMYCKSRAQGFGAEVKRRILIGTYVLSHGYYDAYYLQAQRIRRLIANDFVEAFKQCDVIMGPTSPCTAFKLGEKAPTRCRCTCRTSTPSPSTSPACRACRFPAASTRGCRSGLQLIG
jgi:aspartyl-tRNA(Asn)/glutamyl-tRNA(Gln) amidotransferase subunit A